MVHVAHGWVAMDLQPLGAELHDCVGENGMAAPPVGSSIFVRGQRGMGACEGGWPTQGGSTVHGLRRRACHVSSNTVLSMMYQNENQGSELV